MNTCMLCKLPTNGSVGRAGLRWPNICQKCKDIEDDMVSVNLKQLNSLLKQIEPKPTIWLDSVGKE